MLEVKNETLHQVYFILKTSLPSRAHFMNAAMSTNNLYELKYHVEDVVYNYNQAYPQAPIVDADKLTRDNLCALIDTFVGQGCLNEYIGV